MDRVILACLMLADTLPAKVWTFFGFYIFGTFPLDGGWQKKVEAVLKRVWNKAKCFLRNGKHDGYRSS